jgi:hypothetical protein
MAAVSAVSSSSDAQDQLVKYQQKLAADLAAKAAAKVITADKANVAKAQQAAQQSSSADSTSTADASTYASAASAATTASVGASLDVTV